MLNLCFNEVVILLNRRPEDHQAAAQFDLLLYDAGLL